MAPNILLSCESISKSYGVRALFANLTLALFEGDHVGLIGPNGSGKSTLLKILAGLEPPDDGTRTLRGHTRVGYVPQEPSFPAGFSIEQVLQQTLTDAGRDPHEEGGLIARA
ncbi:MAG: ABC-F family ATP-binding cassette domain-containing protein, partial [Nitrospira sp.]|nr:ABC-F family ATP-binding cassette domain-containing protein [Nitrospira sp.]